MLESICLLLQETIGVLAVTGACAGCAVVDQVSADGLHRDVVQLAWLQRVEAQLVVMLGDVLGVQTVASPVEGHQVAVHLPLARGPAHCQATAFAIVADVEALHFAGHWRKRGRTHTQNK